MQKEYHQYLNKHIQGSTHGFLFDLIWNDPQVKEKLHYIT